MLLFPVSFCLGTFLKLKKRAKPELIREVACFRGETMTCIGKGIGSRGKVAMAAWFWS